MAGYKPGDITAIGGNACDVILAAVLEIKIDVLSVFRKFESRDVSIEVLVKEPGFAALGADYRKMLGGVIAALDIGSRSICDEFAIGMPLGGIVGSRGSRQLNQAFTLVLVIRTHEPYVGVIITVGFFCAVADEGDGFSVVRPRGTGVVIIAGGNLGEFFRFDVIYINVIASTVEIAGVISLELEAVDHPGFAFRPLFRGVFVPFMCGVLVHLVGMGVFQYQEQFFFVTGEVDRADASFETGNLPRLTAVDQIEGPHLRLAAVARREEIYFLSIAAEFRRPGGDRFDRHGDGLAVVSRHHPDACFRTVLFKIAGGDRISRPFAVGRKFGAADILNLEGVVNFQDSQRGRRRFFFRVLRRRKGEWK